MYVKRQRVCVLLSLFGLIHEWMGIGILGVLWGMGCGVAAEAAALWAG